MLKISKTLFIFTFSLIFLSSCTKNQESLVYVEIYSVIKSNAGLIYLASDDGINLYPVNMTYRPEWGAEGDKVVVGFFYNPYTISASTTRMNINIENLTTVPTQRSALPSTADTAGNGTFLYGYGNSYAGIYAWTVQNYLTAIFYIKYGDASKHAFGFTEGSELFRNDTLFLTLWHNAKESDKTRISKSHAALNLSTYYEPYLSQRDSTVISIKYRAETLDSPAAGNYTYNIMYRKKEN